MIRRIQNCMSLAMSLFLEHILFYSVPVQSHDATQEEFHTIDPFNIDVDDTSLATDPTSVTDPPPDLPSAADQPPVVDPLLTVDQNPPPSRPFRNKKSTKLFDFFLLLLLTSVCLTYCSVCLTYC